MAWAMPPSAALPATRPCSPNFENQSCKCKGTSRAAVLVNLILETHIGRRGGGVFLASFALLLSFVDLELRIAILDLEACGSKKFPRICLRQDRMIFLHPNAMSSIGRRTS